MDHAASLPYVLAKTNFQGKVYMTHPTKAIYKWLMQDSVRVQNTHSQQAATNSTTSGSDGYTSQLFTEADVLSTLPLIQTISFNTTHSHNGIKFTPYPAGHVLGACMYLIEIAGLNILFTGDYSRETDRHLIPAAVPRNVRIDCLITESTFGISTHVPRVERETALMKAVTGILNRGGRALLPVPAIGQGQEVLLILEDYWHRHEEFRRYPIYYASSLARKCMVVYQTYIDAMNETIRAKFQASQIASSGADGEASGPWDFRYIRSLKGLDRFDDVGGCVMLASPGMLQNGVSRALLERWAPDPKNGLVITGYSVEGTMAKSIVLEPDTIPAVMTGGANSKAAGLLKRPGLAGGADGERAMIPRRLTVQEFSFAAHVDGSENREFIEAVAAPVVILVHGEKHNMGRLRSRLLGLGKFKVYSPLNCEEVRIPFRREKTARVVGRLAGEVLPPSVLQSSLPSPPGSEDDEEVDGETKSKKAKSEPQILSGVLVQNDFKLSLMAPEDLKEFAGLTTTTIKCRQRITLAAAGTELIRWALEGTFGSINTVSEPNSAGTIDVATHDDADEELQRQQPTVFDIMGGAVRLTCDASGTGEVELEWEANRHNDSVADAVMAVLLTVESSPAAVKKSSKMQQHDHHHHDTSETMEKDERTPNGITKGVNSNKRNPFANPTPEEKLNRLFLFLEAQFGSEAITPLQEPKMPVYTNGNAEDSEADPVVKEKAMATELARLHDIGIPVPGLEIRVDKMVATVWLENGEVESANKTFKERVKAVVERSLKSLGGVWG